MAYQFLENLGQSMVQNEHVIISNWSNHVHVEEEFESGSFFFLSFSLSSMCLSRYFYLITGVRQSSIEMNML